MHLSNLTITLTQVAASVSRVSAYSVATFFLGSGEENKSLLLAIGYVPFLALVDVLTQAYSRALASNNPEKLSFYLKNRLYIAIPFLAAVLGVYFYSLDEIQGTGTYIIILAYSLSGLSQIFESWVAQRLKAFLTALVEIALNLALLIFHTLTEQLQIYSALALLVTFPLSRLIVLAADFNRTPPAISTPSGHPNLTLYVLFSFAQQIVAATSASLPSIYSQTTGNYLNLDRNLVIFRLTHTAATLGSFIINAAGSRIFYGTIGNSFYKIEELFVRSHYIIRITIFSCLLAAAMASTASLSYLILLIPLVLALALLNLESSLLLNAGLPNRTLYFQTCVLSISIILLLNLENFFTKSAIISFFTGCQFYWFGRSAFMDHLTALKTRKN